LVPNASGRLIHHDDEFCPPVSCPRPWTLPTGPEGCRNRGLVPRPVTCTPELRAGSKSCVPRNMPGGFPRRPSSWETPSGLALLASEILRGSRTHARPIPSRTFVAGGSRGPEIPSDPKRAAPEALCFGRSCGECRTRGLTPRPVTFIPEHRAPGI
jgi:hypothetical protein